MKHLTKALAFGLAVAAAFTACAAAATLALGSTKLSAGNATVTACTSSLAAHPQRGQQRERDAGERRRDSDGVLRRDALGHAGRLRERSARQRIRPPSAAAATTCSVTLTSFGATVSAADRHRLQLRTDGSVRPVRRLRLTPRRIAVLLAATVGVGAGAAYAASLSVGSWHLWAGSQTLTKATCTLTGTTQSTDTYVNNSSTANMNTNFGTAHDDARPLRTRPTSSGRSSLSDLSGCAHDPDHRRRGLGDAEADDHERAEREPHADGDAGADGLVGDRR